MCRATTCPPSIRKRRNRKQRNGLAADFGHVEARISSLDVSAGIDFFFFFCQFDFDHFFFHLIPSDNCAFLEFIDLTCGRGAESVFEQANQLDSFVAGK